MGAKHLDAEHILKVLAIQPMRFVTLYAGDQQAVDQLIEGGLAEIIHGAWRSQDMVRITDAGRAALDAGTGEGE